MIRKLYNFVNRNWWQMFAVMALLLAACMCLLFLTGCGDAGRIDPPKEVVQPSLWDILIRIGDKLLVLGSIAFSLGLAARIALFFGVSLMARVPILADLSLLLSSLGLGFSATGAASLWLGTHPWTVILAVVGAGVAVAIVHWHDVRRWLHLGEAPVSTNDITAANVAAILADPHSSTKE